MRGFLLRLVINILGLWLASEIVSGMEISGTGSFVAAALLLGIVNALVRPLAILLTLPFTIATLGLFLLVINAAMLELVSWFVTDFQLAGFGSALLASIVVSLTSWVSSWYIGPRANIDVMVVEKSPRG